MAKESLIAFLPGTLEQKVAAGLTLGRTMMAVREGSQFVGVDFRLKGGNLAAEVIVPKDDGNKLFLTFCEIDDFVEGQMEKTKMAFDGVHGTSEDKLNQWDLGEVEKIWRP